MSGRTIRTTCSYCSVGCNFNAVLQEGSCAGPAAGCAGTGPFLALALLVLAVNAWEGGRHLVLYIRTLASSSSR